jgi:serine/threonine protein kinase
MGETPIAPGQVLFDTMNELEAHAFLKERNLANDLILIEDAVILKEPNGIQICQFLPFAELGNGKEMIKKMSYLGSKEKTIFFNYIMAQLIPVLIKIHAENFAINDIKPENILFSREGISFSDFGAATFLDKNQQIKRASALKDKRYLSPKGYLTQDALSTLNKPDLEKLKLNQCNDLWAFALTLLEFWDQSIIQNYIEASLIRQYSTVPVSEPEKSNPEKVIGFYVAEGSTPIDFSFTMLANNMAGSTTSTSNASNANSSDISPPPLSTVELIRIHKEELEKHVFKSKSFSKLPREYQNLFKKMLDLKTMQPDIIASLHEITSHPALTSIALSNNAMIHPIIKKFLTIPDETFSPELFSLMKEKIKNLLVSFSCSRTLSKDLMVQFDTLDPCDFSTILPLITLLERGTETTPTVNTRHSAFSSKPLFLPVPRKTPSENEETLFEKFINTLNNLCRGEIPHFAAYNELVEIYEEHHLTVSSIYAQNSI